MSYHYIILINKCFNQYLIGNENHESYTENNTLHETNEYFVTYRSNVLDDFSKQIPSMIITLTYI